MTTWILLYVITGFGGYQGNSPITTGSIIFHSQQACEDAKVTFKHGDYAKCFQDSISGPEQPKSTQAPSKPE